ncbi:MAG: recombinase family protein [Bacillota bacterium]
MKKAVAYIRVSGKSDGGSHSFEFQKRYWQDHLARSDEVELFGIYADKGISGRTQEKRLQFVKMIEDCKAGGIDVIYTKSVQRFGRNTAELLQTVRELRDMNVEVIFDKEHISTFQTSSEIYLIIAASIAENDVSTNSLNQKWAYEEKFSKGHVIVGKGVLGYKMTEDNTLEIVEEEAKTVRKIYEMFASGGSMGEIRRTLSAEGYKTKKGSNKWCNSSIGWILDNEKYVGDNLQQKTIVHNGVKTINENGKHGKQWLMENVHPQIVSKELNDKVKARRAEKEKRKCTVQNYTFTGKIECGCCGTNFIRKMQNPKKCWACEVWVCNNSFTHGKSACDSHRIKEEVLKAKFVECYNEYVRLQNNTREHGLSGNIKSLQDSKLELEKLYIKKLITQEYYDQEKSRLEDNITRFKEQSLRNKRKQENKKPITEFNKDIMNKSIEKVIVQDWVVTFKFMDGTCISRKYTNGKCGNKKGRNNL